MRVCKACGLEKPSDQFRVHTRDGRDWVDGKCRACRKKEDTEQKRKKRRGPDGNGYRDYQRNYQRRNAKDLNFAKARLDKTGRYEFGLTCLECKVEIPEGVCKDSVGHTVDEAISVHPACPDCGSKWLVPYVGVKGGRR